MNIIDSIMIFIANSLFMLFFFIPNISFFKKSKYNLIIFIFFWLSGEYLLSKWDLAWPWLNFGNVLANQWYLIKWYSYVGAHGGSLWILLYSLSIYFILFKSKHIGYKLLLMILSLPLLFSGIHYLNNTKSDESTNSKTEILCFIPDLNSAENSTKYQMTKKLYRFIIEKKTPDIVLTPELFYNHMYVNDFKNGNISYFYKEIFRINPEKKVFTGTQIHNSPKIKFNGMSVISKNNIYFRTKKKYVPFTEYTNPYLEPIFGDSYYSMNKEDDTKIIKTKYKTFPFVCYESMFSIFFATNSTNTDFILLSTSESFMNKSGYGKKQYLNIIRIRAIETGRYILKCSNDGYSCLINPDGKIEQYLNKEFETVTITKKSENTFYQKILTFL